MILTQEAYELLILQRDTLLADRDGWSQCAETMTKERDKAILALRVMRTSFNLANEHHKRDHHNGVEPPDAEVAHGYLYGSAVLAELYDLPMLKGAQMRIAELEAELSQLRKETA